ncbi:MAG: FxsA family protein [Thermodesulfobacteriota bacterium]
MLLRLFLAFTLIPVTELYILVKIGNVIGALNTIVLVILTGFAGAWLARLQGFQTMLRIRASLAQNIMPAEEMVDAMLIFGAGLVLLTPGLVTDILGLLLLFPPSRRRFKTWLRRKFDQWMRQDRVHITYYRH